MIFLFLFVFLLFFAVEVDNSWGKGKFLFTDFNAILGFLMGLMTQLLEWICGRFIGWDEVLYAIKIQYALNLLI